MRFGQNLIAASLIAVMPVAGASAQESVPGEPITFLGINALMSEAEVKAALTQRGYSCSVQDDAIPRLAKLNCSKRMGDNPIVPNAGAYANVTLRRSSGEIEVTCLAIADGLGDRGVVTCKDAEGAAHHPRTVVGRMAQAGILTRNHIRKRTGENSACFSSAKKDSLCIEYSEFYKQTRITMKKPG